MDEREDRLFEGRIMAIINLERKLLDVAQDQSTDALRRRIEKLIEDGYSEADIAIALFALAGLGLLSINLRDD
jgi:hypothetical protein